LNDIDEDIPLSKEHIQKMRRYLKDHQHVSKVIVKFAYLSQSSSEFENNLSDSLSSSIESSSSIAFTIEDPEE